MATAATIATPGWVPTSASTAGALMFLPPRMMKSELRPTTVRYPSSSISTRSPISIQPSGVNSLRLASSSP
jgi:hypothetical protein